MKRINLWVLAATLMHTFRSNMGVMTTLLGQTGELDDMVRAFCDLPDNTPVAVASNDYTVVGGNGNVITGYRGINSDEYIYNALGAELR